MSVAAAGVAEDPLETSSKLLAGFMQQVRQKHDEFDTCADAIISAIGPILITEIGKQLAHKAGSSDTPAIPYLALKDIISDWEIQVASLPGCTLRYKDKKQVDRLMSRIKAFVKEVFKRNNAVITVKHSCNEYGSEILSVALASYSKNEQGGP